MRRTLSFQQSLFFNLVFGVVVFGVVIFTASMIANWRVARALAIELTGRSIADTDVRLARYLDPIEEQIELCIDWLVMRNAREQPTQTELDGLLIPAIDNLDQLSAIRIATSRGGLYMLRDLGEEWFSWAVYAQDLRTATVRRWPRMGGDPIESNEPFTGDPRQEQWYKGAVERLSLAEGPDPSDQQFVNWTHPYIFEESDAPGITASIAYEEPESGLLFVLGFDVLLKDIAKFTQDIKSRESHEAFVLLRDVADGSVAVIGATEGADGIPYEGDDRYEPRPLADIGGPIRNYIDASFEVFDDKAGRPRRLDIGLDDWWGAAVRSNHSHDHEIWIGAIVEEDDLFSGIPSTNIIIAVATLVIIVAATLRSRRLARLYGAPIAEIASQSERMGRLNFSREVIIESPIEEIQLLAATQERMRRSLDALSSVSEQHAYAHEVRRERLGAMDAAVGGYSIGALEEVAEQVGGSVCDIIPVTRSPDGKWRMAPSHADGEPASADGAKVLMISLPGQGVRTATQGGQVVAAFRGALLTGCAETDDMLEVVAGAVRAGSGSTGAADFCVGHLAVVEHKLRIWQSGAFPVLHLAAASGNITRIVDERPAHTAAADLSGAAAPRDITFESGDTVMLLSNAVADTLSPDRQRFGIERIESVMRAQAGSDAPAIIAALAAELEEFAAGAPSSVDRTAIVIHRA